MKTVFIAIALILALGLLGFLWPAIVGVVFGVLMIQEGWYIAGILAIIIGVGTDIVLLYWTFADDGPSGYVDSECPYCGSGDTDGNHCHTCGDDF